MPILQTTDLKKYYGDEPNITKALDGASLSVEHGEFVAIVGTSGSGKSTLLNMIGGLDVPTSGKVTVVGETGKHSFTVASGFLDADFQSGRGNERGTAPDLYISQQALKMLSPEVKIFRIAFDTINSKNDERILSELQTITASSSGIDIQSRYERGKEIESYLSTSRVLAMGLFSSLNSA